MFKFSKPHRSKKKDKTVSIHVTESEFNIINEFAKIHYNGYRSDMIKDLVENGMNDIMTRKPTSIQETIRKCIDG